MNIPLVRNNTKDAINTSIIAIKKSLERINSLLGLMDSSEPDLSGLATKQELEDAVTEINKTIDEVETSLQPVDTVTSGNMHSVTSNAVEGAIAPVSNCVFEFPIATHFMSTTSTTYTQYFTIGNNFKFIYDSYPNQINGKTKKLKLAFCSYTAGSNTIDVAMKRQSDQNYVVIMNDIRIWGGVEPEGYGSVIEVGVDPSFIDHHTHIYFKDSDGQGVAIAYCFGRVYYE